MISWTQALTGCGAEEAEEKMRFLHDVNVVILNETSSG